jgi:Ca-activated chloride channel family protein
MERLRWTVGLGGAVGLVLWMVPDGRGATAPLPDGPAEVTAVASPGEGFVARASTVWRAVPTHDGVEAWVVVEVEGVGDPAPMPLDLAIVLDTSGSMDRDGLPQARRALVALAEVLEPADRVSILTFDDHARVVGLDQPPSWLVEVAPTLVVGGGTNLGAGLDRVSSIPTDPGRLARAVVVSDGQPTVGETRSDALAALAMRAGRTVSALGMGTSFDEALLARVAELGGGRYRYAMGPELLALVRDEVTTMRSVVAQSLCVDVVPADGVRILEVAGYADASDAPGLQASLGDVTTGGRRKVALRVALGAGDEVASVRVTGRSVTGAPVSVSVPVTVARTDVAAAREASLVPWAHEAVGRAVVGQARLEARGALVRGDGEEAAARLRSALQELEAGRYDAALQATLREEVRAAEANDGVPMARQASLDHFLEALGYVE